MERINIEELNEQELKNLIESCNKTLKRRTEEKQKEKWNKIVEAVKQYFFAYGAITVEGDDCFTTIVPSNLDKDRPGYISF